MEKSKKIATLKKMQNQREVFGECAVTHSEIGVLVLILWSPIKLMININNQQK